MTTASASTSAILTPLRALVAGLALVASALAVDLGTPDTARAAGCSKVKVGNFKVKRIHPSDGIACGDARRVGKLWVKRDYDDFNPIHVGDNRWFCSWRRKAPKSQTTGTAECDADPGEEISFAVRRR
jgi:hypothetical protein